LECGRLVSELIAVDAIGCSFRQLVYLTDKWAETTVNELKQLCQQLAERLTYLLEPIEALETDSEHCVVQMRSRPPTRVQGGASYYELVASRGGELTLVRFEKVPGKPRTIIPAHVTREVFERLASDFDALAASC
jgi:hypothetical protein